MRPFTQPWASAFCEAVNASTAYREAAKSWTWPLALVLDRAPELGYPADVAILLDLQRGECRSARVLSADELEAAAPPFRVSGDFAAWKEVNSGQLDPITAIMRKRLRLTGSLATIMLHARSAKLLVDCASAVPTEFPDEEAGAPPHD